MDEGLRMALGLALGLVILVLMITKTKIHVFLAVIICSILIGLFGGMGQEDVIASITKGSAIPSAASASSSASA